MDENNQFRVELQMGMSVGMSVSMLGYVRQDMRAIIIAHHFPWA